MSTEPVDGLKPFPAEPVAACARVPGQDDRAWRAMHDRPLGLRGKLEYFYKQLRDAQKQLEAVRSSAAGREKVWDLDLIRVADSLEDAFRAVRRDRKLKKQTAILECFETAHAVLLDVLGAHGVFQVPLEGRTYNGVTFENVVIPQPWSVVQAAPAGERSEQKVAREVVRALWVHVADQKLTILRRGQVNY